MTSTESIAWIAFDEQSNRLPDPGAWMQGDAPADLASIATFRPNYNDVNGIVDIDTSFVKGEALADWLEFVDPRRDPGFERSRQAV